MSKEKFNPDARASAPSGSLRGGYVYDESAVLAVNVAMSTGQPLLICGGPGSGKTSLARDIARQLGWRLLVHLLSPRSEPRDLYYGFDQERRQRDTYRLLLGVERPQGDRYIRRGVLWDALLPRLPSAGSVVLLEDIDRADDQIAYALLATLESGSFDVPELDRTISGEGRILAIITSREHRELPPDFVQKCVRHVLDTPDSATLLRIAAAYGFNDTDSSRSIADKFASMKDRGEYVSPANFLDALQAYTYGDNPADTVSETPSRWIFISYRREDADWFAGRLYDTLVAEFGEDLVFIDIDSLRGGVDFVNELARELAATRVLLVIIGRSWLDMLNRRIGDPNDYVRFEIATALRRGIPVIPITIDGALMPPKRDLPEEIGGLSTRNGHVVTFQNYASEISKVIGALRSALRDRVHLH